jgi:hypothetical protein
MTYTRKPYAGITSAAYYAAEVRNKIYDIRDAGAVVNGSTDDTVAVQDTINAAFADGGGRVVIPDTGNACIIGGALQTNVGGINYNSQLYIPTANVNDQNRVSVVIEGEAPPNFTQSAGIGSAIAPNKGSRLRSTLVSGTALSSVIASKGAAANAIADMNYNQCNVRNLQIQTAPSVSSELNHGGINFSNQSNAIIENVTVFPYNLNLVNSAAPINNCIGIAMPKKDADNMNILRNCSVGGYESGYLLGDHIVMDGLQAISCLYGYNFGANGEAGLATRLGSFWNTNDVYFSGTGYINILELNCELYETVGKWYKNVYTVLDASSNGRGIVNYHIVGAGGGFDNTKFAKSGATKIRCAAITFPSATGFTISGAKGGNAALADLITKLGPLLGIIDATS